MNDTSANIYAPQNLGKHDH